MEQLNLEFSKKQFEFIRESTHRWNGKIGATQCGKTYIDVSYVIVDRIIERKGKKGLNMILGVSKGTIERNILEPMREFWGDKNIGAINSENIAILFGEKVYCLGAEKVSQVSKIRGARIKYLYCDELVEYNQEVFELLKSRLSLPYSICDFTGNPSSPTHWLKSFIDSDADVYCQHWTLDDNPFLPATYVRELKKEYEGTIYYDRYILGLWKRAEGVIYRKFADNHKNFLLRQDQLPPLISIEVGIDFGGNGSAHTFVASGFTRNYRDWIVLESVRIEEQIDSNELNRHFIDFANNVYNKYSKAFESNYDNAEPVLARSISNACMKEHCHTILKPALKMKILQRIRLETQLMGAGRFWVMENAKSVIIALQEAVWDKDHPDERLDDGTSDIDSLDALEYSAEKHHANLITCQNSYVSEWLQSKENS